jgi:hypothetical protein
MRRGRALRRAAVPIALAVLGSGCLFLPSRGTPVIVDQRAGRFWSGDGMLLEVSEDRKSCRVAVRDRSLVFVRRFWTSCAHVHSATTQD